MNLMLHIQIQPQWTLICDNVSANLSIHVNAGCERNWFCRCMLLWFGVVNVRCAIERRTYSVAIRVFIDIRLLLISTTYVIRSTSFLQCFRLLSKHKRKHKFNSYRAKCSHILSIHIISFSLPCVSDR